MAKDPAVLFYYQDFLVGTAFLTNEEKGVYITLLCHLYDKDTLTKQQMMNICKTDDIWKILEKKFLVDENGKYYNQRAREEKLKRVKYTESRRNARLTSNEDQVKIYLMLDKETTFIKIGSSVNPLRRLAEMKSQNKPAITVGNRDYELIFISDVCLRSVESDLHKQFADKKVTGEWFALTESDIEKIKQMFNIRSTSVERMEDENINENINVFKEEKVISSSPEITIQEVESYFDSCGFSKIDAQNFFSYYSAQNWETNSGVSIKARWRNKVIQWMNNQKQFSKSVVPDHGNNHPTKKTKCDYCGKPAGVWIDGFAGCNYDHYLKAKQKAKEK